MCCWWHKWYALRSGVEEVVSMARKLIQSALLGLMCFVLTVQPSFAACNIKLFERQVAELRDEWREVTAALGPLEESLLLVHLARANEAAGAADPTLASKIAGLLGELGLPLVEVIGMPFEALKAIFGTQPDRRLSDLLATLTRELLQRQERMGEIETEIKQLRNELHRCYEAEKLKIAEEAQNDKVRDRRFTSSGDPNPFLEGPPVSLSSSEPSGPTQTPDSSSSGGSASPSP